MFIENGNCYQIRCWYAFLTNKIESTGDLVKSLIALTIENNPGI